MENRVVIITGGASGIGLAAAKKFLEKGNQVVICSTNEGKGQKAVQSLAPYGKALWVRCNVADSEECRKVVEAVKQKFGRIDVLVNSAGIVSKRNSFLEVDLQDVEKTIMINTMGTINMISACTKYMVQQKKGVIVNVGSICGTMANTESVGYHASKGAVAMVTKSLARELSGYGIRVVGAAPGWVHTEMMEDDIADMGAKLHMKGRVIEPEEIAGVIYLLSLDEASAINGTMVLADDGYSSFKGIDGGLML